jgi:predicted component of type VI protein secretion system
VTPSNPDLRDLDVFDVAREIQRRRPGRKAVGEDADPADEGVRFRSDPGLAYRGREAAVRVGGDGVAAIDPPSPDRPVDVYVRWLSLFGSNGVLPYEYTEWIKWAGPNGEPLREFADIALHRPLSLACAAGERLRPGAAYERHRGAAGWSKHDPYLATTLRAAGLFELPDPVADRLAGVMARFGRYVGTPGGLAGAATAHLSVTVRVGRLPARPANGPDHRPSPTRPRFVVRVGPMSWGEYRRLLPPEPGAAPDVPLYDLLVLTRLFAGVRRFTVELLLRPGEQPPPADPGAGRRWASTWPIDRGDEPRIGTIPSAVCEQVLNGPIP